MSGTQGSGRHPANSLEQQRKYLGLTGGQCDTDAWKKKRKPACPKWLDGPARSEWAYVCDDLAELGLLTKLSRAELRSYVMMYHLQRMAYEDIMQRGVTVEIETANGASIKRNPSVDGCARATSELMRIIKRWLPREDNAKDENTDQTTALGHFLQQRSVS